SFDPGRQTRPARNPDDRDPRRPDARAAPRGAPALLRLGGRAPLRLLDRRRVLEPGWRRRLLGAVRARGAPAERTRSASRALPEEGSADRVPLRLRRRVAAAPP